MKRSSECHHRRSSSMNSRFIAGDDALSNRIPYWSLRCLPRFQGNLDLGQVPLQWWGIIYVLLMTAIGIAKFFKNLGWVSSQGKTHFGLLRIINLNFIHVSCYSFIFCVKLINLNLHIYLKVEKIQTYFLHFNIRVYNRIWQSFDIFLSTVI